MVFKLKRYTKLEIMAMMGIKDWRTYNNAISEHAEEIGEPINYTYTIHQVVKIVMYYEYLFTEPLECTEALALYRNHLQSVAYLKNLLQSPTIPCKQ